jgi:hypothetical protein
MCRAEVPEFPERLIVAHFQFFHVFSENEEKSAMSTIRVGLALVPVMVPFGAGANQLFVSPKGSDRGQYQSAKNRAPRSVERATWPTVAPTASPT